MYKFLAKNVVPLAAAFSHTCWGVASKKCKLWSSGEPSSGRNTTRTLLAAKVQQLPMADGQVIQASIRPGISPVAYRLRRLNFNC